MQRNLEFIVSLRNKAVLISYRQNLISALGIVIPYTAVSIIFGLVFSLEHSSLVKAECHGRQKYYLGNTLKKLHFFFDHHRFGLTWLKQN